MTTNTPSTIEQPTIIDAEFVDAVPIDNSQPVPRRKLRLGKIARLPKAERDMVNQLLQNNVPYSRIVWALSERRITVTERNISNWRVSGGYEEWRAEQDNQVRLGQIQDHVLDYLRKNDGHQIAEVGLQVAATQLTTSLMNPETARKLLADPKQYKEVIGMLAQCSTQLSQLDDRRRESIRKAGHKDSPDNIRWENQQEIDCIREIAEAEEMAECDLESHVPHRNALPPRETLPVDPPGPTIGEKLGLVKKLPSKRHYLIQNALACGVNKPAPRNKSPRRLIAPAPSPKPLPPSDHVAADVSSAPISNNDQTPSTDANGSSRSLTEGLRPSNPVAADVSSALISGEQTPATDAHGSLRTLTEGLPPSDHVTADVSSAPISSDAQTPATDAYGSLRSLTEGLPPTEYVTADVSSAPISEHQLPG